ncbi:Cyclic nucleotide-binding domain [Phytophthora infestans]|uniref:Cyclic nucleotide-binding domain n=1 Tax=Phytophthora infestans TaxID=4787 RepID=A0A833TPA8_PHYIN|nr:Cyclic nucleotide-binding domain [Phytophthora infestans]KAF4140261.1 Cyclic nucleotide-binding domain [Phytophthora infestans]
MERTGVDELEGQCNDILPKHKCISPEEFRRMERRLDEVQSSILATNKMLRELSTYVHRQQQAAEVRTQTRRLSDSASPSMLALGKPIDSLVAIDVLRPGHLEEPQDTEATILSDSGSRPHVGTSHPLLKKFSMPIAIPDPSLSSEWLAKVEVRPTTPKEKPRLSSKIWIPFPIRNKIIPFTKARKLTKLASVDRDLVSRRFSVSSINLARSQSIAITESQNSHEDPCITPEEIMSARKLEGEMNRFSIHHDSPYRTAWDILVIIMILLDLVFTPLSLGFNYKSKFLSSYSTLESMVFFVDFLVRMFSSFSDEHGNLISGPKQTVMNYLSSGWALPDLLSWFPFELFMRTSHSEVVGFLKIFRLAKVSHLAHKLHSAKKAGIVRFVLLLGLVLTISHLLTCYWSWVAVDWRTHLEDGSFVPRTLFEEYSLCWSLVIGCVNASPPIMYSTIELISVACFMLVGNILQASVFGAVAALIASIDENEAAYSKKIISTSERCRFLGISEELSNRIRGYYENLWRETKSVSADADAFINELSPALICEVKFQLYRDMLKRIPFLSSRTLAPAVIEVLVLHLRTVIYMQDDVLIRKDEFGDWMGFIGSKGSVGVLDPNSDMIKIIHILHKGEYFGEMALLQHTRRSATAIALTWVQIHVLCRQDLDYVKELYPTQSEILQSEIAKYKQWTAQHSK